MCIANYFHTMHHSSHWNHAYSLNPSYNFPVIATFVYILANFFMVMVLVLVVPIYESDIGTMFFPSQEKSTLSAIECLTSLLNNFVHPSFEIKGVSLTWGQFFLL